MRWIRNGPLKYSCAFVCKFWFISAGFVVKNLSVPRKQRESYEIEMNYSAQVQMDWTVRLERWGEGRGCKMGQRFSRLIRGTLEGYEIDRVRETVNIMWMDEFPSILHLQSTPSLLPCHSLPTFSAITPKVSIQFMRIGMIVIINTEPEARIYSEIILGRLAGHRGFSSHRWPGDRTDIQRVALLKWQTAIHRCGFRFCEPPMDRVELLDWMMRRWLNGWRTNERSIVVVAASHIVSVFCFAGQ